MRQLFYNHLQRNFYDLPSFYSKGIFTGIAVRPDFILVDKTNSMVFLELTMGHESTTESNATRKATKYKLLFRVKEEIGGHNEANFCKLVMNAIRRYSNGSFYSLQEMLISS